MQFFTSSNDLKKWVKSFNSADEAALNIMEVVGKNEERDIVQSCRSIFDNQDDSASNVLFGILSKHNITQIREGNMKDKLVKQAQAVMRSDSLYGNMDKLSLDSSWESPLSVLQTFLKLHRAINRSSSTVLN